MPAAITVDTLFAGARMLLIHCLLTCGDSTWVISITALVTESAGNHAQAETRSKAAQMHPPEDNYVTHDSRPTGDGETLSKRRT